MSGKGRRRIDMKKIEKPRALQVAFSKRYQTIFQKASELSTLCGSQSAIVLVSPAGKPVTFGHPSAEQVIDRFLNNDNIPPQEEMALVHETYQHARNRELMEQYAVLKQELDAAKHQASLKRTEIQEKSDEIQRLLRANIDDLSFEELEQLMGMLSNIRMKVREESNAADAGPSATYADAGPSANDVN